MAGPETTPSGSSSAAFGTLNTATGANSFVAGHSNKATGIASAVGGGSGNQAAGTESSVTGGEFNLAFGPFSSISGGCQGVVGIGTAIRGTCGSSGYESISGGFDNRATALGSSVSAGEFNLASDQFSSITGGCDGLTGSGTAPANFCGSSGFESISGGSENNASGVLSSISGGDENTASSGQASISGGTHNTASGDFSSILGGNSVSVSATDGTAPTGVIGSVTGSVGFTLGANACGAFTVGDGALQPGDVPLFAYTTTPPSGNVLFTPGAVLTAGQAKFTACNQSSSSTTFSGSIHVVAFRG